MKMLKRLRRGLTVSLVVLLATVVVGEIVVRLIGRVVPPVTVRDPAIGRRYVKNFDQRVYNPESESEVGLRFNNLGFRGPDRTLEKPVGVKRVAVIGDSMIAGLTVEENDTAVARLQAGLAGAYPEFEWEVMNFGVSGSSTGQELVLYREVVAAFRPDIVLGCFFVGNDMADNCRRLTSNPRIYFDLDEDGELVRAPFGASRASASDWLNRNSRLYLFVKESERSLRSALKRSTPRMTSGQWVYCSQPPEDVAYAWTLSETLIRTLRSEVEADGASFGLVVIPCALQVYDDYLAEVAELAGELGAAFDRDYPDERLAALCAEAEIPIMVMTDRFRAAAPGHSQALREEWLFRKGSGHFNERGHALAAEGMLALFEQLPWRAGEDHGALEARPVEASSGH
jgi:hypothetical protein